MFRKRWMPVALIAILGALAGAAFLTWRVLFADLPGPWSSARQMPAPGPAASILITDRNGRLLYEAIAQDADPERAAEAGKHIPVPLAEIPLACQRATLATEDSRFYEHPGIDPLAIARAAWRNWRGEGAFSGASTLSQQLARNLYMSEDERSERTVRRKLREAWLAWLLERRHSKDELLALYLNTSYYGHFAIGIEAAAQSYFGTHARELDLAQCALLAGLLQYPAGYNPIEYPEAAHLRQGVVLGLMRTEGYITQAQAEEAHQERLAYASTPFPIEAPHFVMWVQGQLEQSLGTERTRSGGIRVVTTLDMDWQRQAEEIVTRRLAALRPCAAGADPDTCDRTAEAARRVENAGLVVLDPRTGAVLAMVGNPDYFDRSISGAVNTTLALRQPGSAIKPLTYALALDPAEAAAAGRRPWTPATLVADIRTVFPTAEGQPYVPQNYDQAFHGPVTVRTALADSYNIPAVKALQVVGIDRLIELANRLGIPWKREAGDVKVDADAANSLPPASGFSQPKARYGLSLTLGGGEVRLIDLAAAYAAFANGGHRVTPFGISRVETLEGQVLFDTAAKRAHTDRSQVVDARVAYLITDILSDAESRQAAFGAANVLEIGRPAAVKTGTTTDWRDNWTIGYSPDWVVGVWVGNADNTPMAGVSGVTGAAPIWHDFLASIERNTPPRSFARPAGLVELEVCADSGLRAECSSQAEGCGTNQAARGDIAPAAVSPRYEIVPCPSRRREVFIAGTEPTQVDTSHVRVALDVRSGEPADARTPAELTAYETYWLLPPEFREWAREKDIPQPVAVDRPALEGPSQPQGPTTFDLQITSPDPNRSYRLDPGLPRNAQRLPITARPGPGIGSQDASVTIYLDGAPLAEVQAPDFTAWWPLARGRHTFQAVVTGLDGKVKRSDPVVVFVEE